jgi:hypothetical protein
MFLPIIGSIVPFISIVVNPHFVDMNPQGGMDLMVSDFPHIA